MKSIILGMTQIIAMGCFAATVTTNSTSLTIDVPSGESYRHVEATPSTFTKVIKQGAGSCEFAPGSVTFTGAIEILAGTMHGDRSKFGTPASWKVLPGASLRFDSSADYAAGEAYKPTGALEIGGMGCNDYPAYYFGMDGSSHWSFGGDVTLTADTSVGGGRFGLAGGKLDMQGYDLHLYCTRGTAQYEMYSNVSNPGNVRVKTGKVLVQNGIKFTPSTNGKAYILSDGTEVDMWNFAGNTTSAQTSMLDINLENGATAKLLCQGGTDPTRNAWLGDWHLGRGNRFYLTVDTYGTMKGSIDGGAELYKNGAGPYTITSDGVHKFKNIYVEKGRLALGRNSDNSPYLVTNHWYVTGADCTGANVARLEIGAGARAYSDLGRDTASISVGLSAKAGSQAGIVTIADGAVVSNDFRLAMDQSAGWHKVGMAAIYMDDATVFWRAGAGNDGFIGGINSQEYTYGYFCQNAGLFSHLGYMNIGSYGHGCIDQRGGVHRIETGDPLKFARTGRMSWACYHQTGGTFDGKAVWFNHQNNTNCSAVSVLTTSGANTLFKSIQMIADMSRVGVDTFVNVNDGATLQGRLFRQIRFSGYNAANWTALATEMSPTTRLYLNLNGGVLKNSDGNDANLWGADRLRGPTRATVYEKGVTFDTSAGDITLFSELVRPFGKGIKSIAVPSSISAANYYISSPRVKITSGTGTGAAAYAVFNEKTRQIVRIDVTSPGCGYEDAAISVESNTVLNNDSFNDIVASSFELADLSTTGGVRKVGSGALTLKCPNTYGGVTRVEGGTIAFTDAAGLPQNSALEFSAAVVSGSDKTAPILTAVNYNGGVVRITEAETLDCNTFGRSQPLLKFTNAPVSLPTLKFVRSDGTEMPTTSWKLLFASDGTIKFGRDMGLVISVQ